ncbi:MAG: N-acetyltransferase [Bacteroidia bacterium]
MKINLLEDCILLSYDELNLEGFDCGNTDLNEFFKVDAPNYTAQLLGKTYGFALTTDPRQVVGVFTISNESIKVQDLPNSRKKKINKRIPRTKQFKSYPATLLGRLGINKAFQGGGEGGAGDQIIDFVKYWFVDPKNKTGCRFLVVDAYNTDKVISFYKRTGFQEVFSSDEQEFEYHHTDDEFEPKKVKTRLLSFDLIQLLEK